MTKGDTNVHMRPIFDVMYDAHLIEKKMFSLCLGKDGGYFQIGGYDSTNHLSQNVQWVPFLTESYGSVPAYRVEMKGFVMNGHQMAGTHIFDRAVMDSGTTFTYVPAKLFKIISDHFDWFCLIDSKNHCKGKRIHNGQGEQNSICFNYDESKYPNGPKDYFVSYPMLGMQVPTE